MAPDYQGHECQDLNGDGTGLGLAHPTDGKGADWLHLWQTYGGQKAFTSASEFLQ